MKLYRKAKGKEEVILEGDRTKVQKRMKALRKSQRNGVCGYGGLYKTEYRIGE